MAAGGRRTAKPTASRNITSVPSMTRSRRRPAASVRRHRRNIRPSVKGGDLAAHFNQTDPAGKHPYSPVHIRLPAMSHCLTDRQQKNPPLVVLPPPDSPVSMVHRVVALRAALPAEAAYLRRKPLTALVSAAVAAAVSPRTLQEKEASAAQPGIPVLEVHPPGPHRKRKCLSPAQQEQRRSSGKDRSPVKNGSSVSHPGMAGTATGSRTPPGQKLGGGPSKQKSMRQT